VSESDSRASTWAHFPLVVVLAVVAGSELLVNRILGHLIEVDPFAPRTPFRRGLTDVRLFLYELTAVLTVLMLGAALARVSFGGSRYRLSARISFGIVGTFCVLLAARGAVTELRVDHAMLLHLSFAFLALLVTMTVLAARAPARVRLGTVILFLPAGLHFAARLSSRLTPVPELVSTPLELEAIAQATLAAAAVVSVPCFASRKSGLRLGVAVAAALVGAAAVVIRVDWDTAARVAGYGFGVQLPIAPWALLVYLLAFGGFAFTVVTLLSSSGAERLRGYGLLFYGMAGLDYQAPFQMALAALGLLCIAESVLRNTTPPMERALFETLVRRGAAAVGAPHVVLTGAQGYETVRLHSPAGDGGAPFPVALTIARVAGLISSIDVVIGDEMPRDPPFTLERRDARRLGPRADGPAIDTGDATFDRAFVTRDRRGLNAQLLDDGTRARLRDLCAGWVGVWPQRGVRYRAQALGGGGEDALPLLIELLRDLMARSTTS
jgi:hypothetical protein